MIDKIKWILKKWGQSIVELLIFFPALLIIGIHAIPHNLLWIWLGSITVYYLAGLLAGALLNRNRIIIHILAGMIISGVGAYLLFDMRAYILIPWILGAAAFVRGMKLRVNRWKDIFPAAGLWIGLVVYFIGYFFFTRVQTLKSFSSVFGWVGAAYMVLVLFIINSTQLKAASLPGDREPVLPRVIKKNNRVLISIMLLIITIIYFFDNLKQGVTWLANQIGYIIVQIILFITELLAPGVQQGTPDSGGGGFQGLFPPVEEKAPSIFDRIVEYIAIVLAVAAGLTLLSLLGFVIYQVFKKAAAWLSRFYQLKRSMEDYGGYVDEKESLIDFRELRKDYARRFRQWLAELMEREPKWDELKTNRERIRYIYRHFLLRSMAHGYSFKEHLTPAETGKELSEWKPEKSRDMKELTAAYDDVRYGDKDIDDNRLKELIEAFLNKD